jgi:hypothetical protein
VRLALIALIIVAFGLAIDGHPYSQNPVNQVEQNKTATNASKQTKDAKKQEADSGRAVNHAASEQEASSGEGNRQQDTNRQIQRVEITAQPTDGVAVTSAVITGLALLASWGAIWLLWRQNNHMRDSSERQLRAYVGISVGYIDFKNRIPIAYVKFKNAGQTPAYDVRTWIHTWYERHPLTVNLPVPDDGFERGKSIIHPGGHESISSPPKNPICADHFGFVGTEEWTIYVYGEIQYRDAFGKQRYTKYRLIYGGPEGGSSGRLCADTEGNEAN